MANDDQEIMIIIFLVTLFKIMNENCKFLKERCCVGKLGGGGDIPIYGPIS